MPPPPHPKIYHIAHVDRLSSIIADGHLWSDSVIASANRAGTVIGMSSIKRRRLTELKLVSHPDLFVGQCVPFYFCPRSIMLYLIHCANHPELAYTGGAGPIIHFECDLTAAVEWATATGRRWAFTLSNAGAYYFEDRADLSRLGEVNWDAVATNRWSGNGISRQIKEGKQAEFLMEHSFPWSLVQRIGVASQAMGARVTGLLAAAAHRPPVHILPGWYY